jgi:hypothetical protein
MLKELAPQAEQAKTRDLIAFAEKKIAHGRETSETQTRTVVRGSSYAISQALSESLADIANREREVKAYQEHSLALQAEIEGLALTPKEAARRRALQGALTVLTTERFEKDQQTGCALQGLKEILQERALITGRMRDLAAKLDFGPEADFDEARFASLCESLPDEVAATSEEWVKWFTGRDTPKDPSS